MNRKLCAVSSILIIAFAMAWPMPVHAKDTGIGDEYPGIMRGVRPLGMGNAFAAMPGTDFNAQFYNPAAINDFEKKRHYLFINPQADFDTGIFSMIKDVLDLKDDLNAAADDSAKIDVFDTFTQAHAGQFNQVSSNMPLFHIRHKYYAAGLVFNTRSIISLRNQAFPNFEVKSTNHAGAVGGGAYAFFDDTLQVGGNLKVLYGVGIEDQITSSDITNRSIGAILGWNNWRKGVGVGVDLGSKYKLPFAQDLLQPTLAVVIQDVAHTRFTGGVNEIPMSLTAGAGIFPKIKDIQLAILADFREISQRIGILKKLHFGVEAKFPEVIHTKFSVRAGCNQGYPAAGFSAEWPIVALNFAFYGEEMGEFKRSKASYRLASQLTFGF